MNDSLEKTALFSNLIGPLKFIQFGQNFTFEERAQYQKSCDFDSLYQLLGLHLNKNNELVKLSSNNSDLLRYYDFQTSIELLSSNDYLNADCFRNFFLLKQRYSQWLNISYDKYHDTQIVSSFNSFVMIFSIFGILLNIILIGLLKKIKFERLTSVIIFLLFQSLDLILNSAQSIDKIFIGTWLKLMNSRNIACKLTHFLMTPGSLNNIFQQLSVYLLVFELLRTYLPKIRDTMAYLVIFAFVFLINASKLGLFCIIEISDSVDVDNKLTICSFNSKYNSKFSQIIATTLPTLMTILTVLVPLITGLSTIVYDLVKKKSTAHHLFQSYFYVFCLTYVPIGIVSLNLRNNHLLNSILPLFIRAFLLGNYNLISIQMALMLTYNSCGLINYILLSKDLYLFLQTLLLRILAVTRKRMVTSNDNKANGENFTLKATN